MKTIWTSVFVILSIIVFGCSCASADGVGGCTGCHSEIVENFKTSLHYTGSGMCYEYEIYAADYFDIDMDEYYQKFNCNKCHASTCTVCHIGYSATSSDLGHGDQANITIDTCEPCHGKKQTSTFVGDMPMHKSQGPAADIHYEAGMICTDCHTSSELHGTGVKYSTQLAAVTVKCEDCHSSPGKIVNTMEVTQYSPESYSHSLHGNKLSCIACHSSWVLSCQGCHLEDRKGMTVTPDEFYLGVNKDEQITTFLKMEAKYNETHNETHIGLGEWYGHTATDEPKECDFCHKNAKVFLAGYTIGNDSQIIGEGGSLVDNETIERVLNAELIYAPEETPSADDATSGKTPGFEAVFALAGLLAVAYLVLRRRE